MLISIGFAPGVARDVSPYALGKGGGPGWIRSINCRFINGFAAKRGGSISANIKFNNEGTPRDAIIWKDSSGIPFMAIGTHQKVLLIYEGQYYDITPTGQTGINVEDNQDYDTGTGWGSGEWNVGTWGTPRDVDNLQFEPTQFSFANFGEDLVIVHTNGRIYFWDRSTSVSGNTISRAVELQTLTGAEATAPNLARVCVTSDDRHLILGGVDPESTQDNTLDPMLVRWGHRESLTIWTTHENYTAGSYRLDIGTKIVSMIRTRQEIIIFTDFAVYRMVEVGPPYYFRIDLIGTDCGAMSKNAALDINGVAWWLSPSGVYRYDGAGVQEVAFPSKHYFFDDLDQAHREQVFAASNTQYDEIAFHYIANDGSRKYVVYDYRQGVWSEGTTDATLWLETDGIYDKPISFNREGQMRFEESGNNVFTDRIEPLEIELESAPLELNEGAGEGVNNTFFQEGNSVMYMRRAVPDFHRLQGTLTATLTGRKYPIGTELPEGQDEREDITSNLSLDENMPTWDDAKFRARQMSLKLSNNELNSDFQMGIWRFDLEGDGNR